MHNVHAHVYAETFNILIYFINVNGYIYTYIVEDSVKGTMSVWMILVYTKDIYCLQQILYCQQGAVFHA
jgi:hypothetical protein